MKKGKKLQMLDMALCEFNDKAKLNTIKLELEIHKLKENDKILDALYELKLDIYALLLKSKSILSEDKENINKNFEELKEDARKNNKKANKDIPEDCDCPACKIKRKLDKLVKSDESDEKINNEESDEKTKIKVVNLNDAGEEEINGLLKSLEGILNANKNNKAKKEKGK